MEFFWKPEDILDKMSKIRQKNNKTTIH
jgi:hypothetical protein